MHNCNHEYTAQLEILTLWFARYIVDADFACNEEYNASEATYGNVSALEAKLDSLRMLTGCDTFYWEE